MVPFKQSQIIFLQILSTAGTIDSNGLFKKSVKHESFSEKIPSSKGIGQTTLWWYAQGNQKLESVLTVFFLNRGKK